MSRSIFDLIFSQLLQVTLLYSYRSYLPPLLISVNISLMRRKCRALNTLAPTIGIRLTELFKFIIAHRSECYVIVHLCLRSLIRLITRLPFQDTFLYILPSL